MRLSKRLKDITEFIDENDKIVDVGCDHALLDIYTILNNKNSKCIASDINEGPLKVAKENVKKYNLEKKIKVKLGDGLDVYETSIETIIMSGLGSYTIIDILNKKKSVYHRNYDNSIYYTNKNSLKKEYIIDNTKDYGLCEPTEFDDLFEQLKSIRRDILKKENEKRKNKSIDGSFIPLNLEDI